MYCFQFARVFISPSCSTVLTCQVPSFGSLQFRTLDNKALAHVLSFVGKSPSSYAVCKYWKVVVDENQQKLSSSKK